MANPPTLSQAQLRYLALAWQCFESEPKINYDRFASLIGSKSAASAREMLRQTKKKLLEAHPKRGRKPKGDDDDDDDDDDEEAAPKNKKKKRGAGGGGGGKKSAAKAAPPEIKAEPVEDEDLDAEGEEEY
ncbi:hypothetical protein H2203_002786 [Taxawa tesnikishii (nom. ined.)]|nr:hypothetical protein H2203_002786 [Dothideales sp. JES 119]